MGKIVYLMGPSSSGKDTIYKKLIDQQDISFHTVVLYTTRPIRAGETNGVEYQFTDEEGYRKLKSAGKVIEDRSYDTIQGVWRYFTVLDGQLLLDKYNYLMIGTLESYQKTKEYLGSEKLIPIYIELEDGERLQRALDRERAEKKPHYAEMCRRYLADLHDFSEEKQAEAGIEKKFSNYELSGCLNEIMEYLHTALA